MPSDMDAIHEKLEVHCKITLRNMISSTRAELGKIHCRKIGVRYNKWSSLVKWRMCRSKGAP